MPRRKRRLSQHDLRTLGVRPGLVATRYTPDGERAEIRQLTAEDSRVSSLFCAPDQTIVRTPTRKGAGVDRRPRHAPTT